MRQLPPAILRRLRDGQTVRVRPITPADAPRLMAFHERLSVRTTRFRFFSPMKHLSEDFASRLANVDFVKRFAFVISEPADDAIHGVGRFEAQSSRSGEVAFVVEDSLQGLGLGSLLLERIVAHARKLGYERLTALVLADNDQMLNIFRESGLDPEIHTLSDVTSVKLDIRPKKRARALL
jgi:GNAT superfamily N-acetyltransferase